VAWQKLAELCKQYLAKGRAVLVEGKLQSRSWETEDGQKRSMLEVRADRIEFLDRGDAKPGPDAGAPAAETGEPAAPQSASAGAPQVDDDLPF